MSKNTKIIAIVGGVLILGVVAYMLFTGGSTMDAMGCGSKKHRKARSTSSKADVEVRGCKKFGYIPKVVQKGKKGSQYWTTTGGKSPEPRGGKANLKKATCDCLAIWTTECGSDAKDSKGKTFKEKNGKFCASKAKEVVKKGCGGDEGGDDDDE